jgi:ribonuclease P protein component
LKANGHLKQKLTFKKNERLCSEKLINSLFDRKNPNNQTAFGYPLRVVFQVNETLTTTQVLFSVSKRSFKKAVDRNLVRRRIREAYRLNKSNYKFTNTAIGFIYIGQSIEDYEVILKGMKKVLKELEKSLNR